MADAAMKSSAAIRAGAFRNIEGMVDGGPIWRGGIRLSADCLRGQMFVGKKVGGKDISHQLYAATDSADVATAPLSGVILE